MDSLIKKLKAEGITHAHLSATKATIESASLKVSLKVRTSIHDTRVKCDVTVSLCGGTPFTYACNNDVTIIDQEFISLASQFEMGERERTRQAQWATFNAFMVDDSNILADMAKI